MSVHHRECAAQHELTANDGNGRPAKVHSNNGESGTKVARWPGFIPPTLDQDRLTIILLMIIMVLSGLDFMLRFPDLGAVIAQYNQF
jgi:hypothetical protein